jgi:DNA polymerase-3 subunit delta
MDFNGLLKEIQKNKFAPVYFLIGEEPYFIDKITQKLESSVVEESLRGFNQDIIYGNEATGAKLSGLLRSYPVMAPQRLVILKEAQKMKKDELEILETYFRKPAESTVFVIAYKDSPKKLDGRSKLAKTLKANPNVIRYFESKKIYENKIGEYIRGMLSDQDLHTSDVGVQLLSDAFGTQLSLLEKEIEKLAIQLRFLKQKELTKEFILDYVNIDRDYNVYELQDAVGNRNLFKSLQIVDQMSRNFGDNSPVKILSTLFRFFHSLALCKYLKTEQEQEIAKTLHLSSAFLAKNYKPGLRNFSATRIRENLLNIAQADLMIKGITPSKLPQEHTLKQLVYQLIN